MAFQTVQDWASYYIARGWQVVPLAPNSKAPTDDGWLRLIFQADQFELTDGLGIRSVNGLVVVDLDSPEAVRAADAFLPPTGAVYGRASKPRAKRLYYAAFPKTIALRDSEDNTTLLEVRSQHQDAAPPTINPSGERLEWDGEIGEPTTVESAELMRSARLVATTSLIAKYYASPGARHDWCLSLSGAFRRFGLSLEEAVKVLETSAKLSSDPKVSDRLTEVRSTYAKADDEPIKSSKQLNELSSSKSLSQSLQKIWGSTSSVFIMNDKGEKPLANHQENVKRALTRLDIDLTYNAFSQKPLIKFNGYNGVLQDEIRNHLWLEIDKRFGFRPNGEFFDTVLSVIAHENEFHPVRDYLTKLEWDGVPRIETWVIKHGQAPDTPYVRAVSSLVLVAAVRRVTQPGCKFDELMVLESRQGLLKSSALRALCPKDDWFSDDLPLNVESKQIIERTLGKWIIEAGELSGMHRSQVEHLKNTLSRQVDGPVRLAYARLPVERPRQFIVIGTTNSHHYLKDTTGNRRFWPVRVQRFNVNGIIDERDQLWAEAYAREREGASIRLLPTLWEHAGMQQERRRAQDPWEAHLSEQFNAEAKHRLTQQEVWEALGMPVAQRDQSSSERLHSVMQRLGFRRVSIRRGTDIINGWGRDADQLDFTGEEI